MILERVDKKDIRNRNLSVKCFADDGKSGTFNKINALKTKIHEPKCDET